MHSTLSLAVFALPALLASPAFAQDVLYVSDIAATGINEGVFRLTDANMDGDMDDVGDIVKFYDDVAGGFDLATNQGVCVGANDTVYVSDSANDIILALHDNNADLDANDPGEAVVFFDGTATAVYGGNVGGVLLDSSAYMYFDTATGKLWIAKQNSGSGVLDEVLVLQDLNMDGDANDAGEVTSWWTAPNSTYGPMAVVVSPTGVVYYNETASGPGKGVYALIDLNMDGDAQDPGERVTYCLLPTATTSFAWSLEVDAQGALYMADTASATKILYRIKDLNNDGDALDAGELVAWYTDPAPSQMWDIAVNSSGVVYVSEGSPNVRTLRLFDANNDGVIGAGEATTIYTAAGNPTVITAGRGIAVVSGPTSTVSTPLCFGDGTDTPCPCTNNGNAGRGCENTSATGGAALSSSGVASISADTLVLNSTFAVPFGPGLYYEGSTTANPVAPFGVPFGNGLRCAGGTTNRLEIRFADSVGAASTTVSLAAFGAAVAGNTYYYQLWYRDTGNVGTCLPGAGFNFSNALSLAWVP